MANGVLYAVRSFSAVNRTFRSGYRVDMRLSDTDAGGADGR
jgi:hypothetical protein